MTRKKLHEGKAKIVYEGDNNKEILLYFKDDATAFNAKKKGTIINKGIINLDVSLKIYEILEKNGIEHHFIKKLSDREVTAKKAEIIPIEVVMRNYVAGSLAKRLGLKEGEKISSPLLEFYYKDDDLDDPMINEYHALVFNYATKEEIEKIKQMSYKINDLLIDIFAKAGIQLVDYKLEFGRFEGKIILCDELSPDSARLWDKTSGEKLDKDRFRQNMGKIEESYQDVHRRIMQL